MQQAKARAQTAEEEQQRLAAEEEFERAEALNEVIQRSSAEAHSRIGTLADLRASVRMLEQTFAQERADCVSNFLSAANSLRATREQLEVALTQQQTSAQRQWDLEDSRIKAELERIGLEKGHFEREEKALSGDSERTEEAIRTQTGDLSSRKQELESSMDDLSEEIRILQEQLALKLAAQQQLARDLDLVDGKIGEVRKKYDRQLQRISDRQHALQQSKAECLEEESAVLAEQAVMEAQAAEHLRKKQEATAWATSLVADIQVADVLLDKLKPSGALTNAQIATISPLETATEDATTTELKRSMDAISYLLNKKRLQTTELHSQRDDLVSESRRLADLALVLDAEKKSHAAAKRFKEAAAAAKELKEVQAAKEVADASIEGTDSAMAATSLEIAQLEEQEVKTANSLRDAHRQGDIARFEALLTRASEVRAMHKKVVRFKRRLDGVVVPKEDIGEGVVSFLLAELDAIQREALSLKALHSLPHDVLLLTAVTEDDVEVEVDETDCTIENPIPPSDAAEQNNSSASTESTSNNADPESSRESKDATGFISESIEYHQHEFAVETDVLEGIPAGEASSAEELESAKEENEETKCSAEVTEMAGDVELVLPDSEEQLAVQRATRMREAKVNLQFLFSSSSTARQLFIIIQHRIFTDFDEQYC